MPYALQLIVETLLGIQYLKVWWQGLCDVQRDDTTLEITELPVRKWTQDYKEFLESLIKPEDKNASALLEVCFHSQLFH